MSGIKIGRGVVAAVSWLACSLAVVLFAGCDLGTYSERIESNGGKLPMTAVSQDSGSGSKASGSKAKANGSDSKDAGSGAKDSGSGAKDAGSDTKDDGSETKKMTSLSDIQKGVDQKRERESEAEARSRGTAQ